MTVSADRTAEVIKLLASYSAHMDNHKAADWVDLFSKTGKIDMVGMGYTATGPEELAGFIAQGQGGVHLTGLPLITDDDGVLRATSPFTYVNTPKNVVMTGYYRDELVDEDGSLRFAVREIEIRRD